MDELLAIYYYNGKSYEVYGCWNEDTSENEFDFYDIYYSNNSCINEGVPFSELPSRNDLIEFLNENNL